MPLDERTGPNVSVVKSEKHFVAWGSGWMGTFRNFDGLADLMHNSQLSMKFCVSADIFGQ